MKVKELNKIVYESLNNRQKQTYNFQKVAAILADYGFETLIQKNDDVDFTAKHFKSDISIRVILKGRMTFDKKYIGKSLFICFPYEGHWYLYHHDELFDKVAKPGRILGTTSWDEEGLYHFPSISPKLQEMLREWRL